MTGKEWYLRIMKNPRKTFENAITTFEIPEGVCILMIHHQNADSIPLDKVTKVVDKEDIHLISEAEMKLFMRGYLKSDFYDIAVTDIVEKRVSESAISVDYSKVTKKDLPMLCKIRDRVKNAREIITEEETIKIYHVIDLSRYKWLPKKLYREFIKCVCKALGIEFEPEMVDSITSSPLTPKAVIIFPPKTKIAQTEKKLQERSESVDNTLRDAEDLIKMLEKMKSGK